jgi:serine/threonine protein kinase
VSDFQPIPQATQPYVDRLIGAQVGEHRVDERICEGRWGTLYRCRDLQTGHEAALEVLRAQLVDNEREAGAANAFKCPGVAVVRGFGELPDGRRYRVMDPLPGRSLEQALQSGARLTPEEATKVLAAVAHVLATAHAWGVAHGRLGPSSVFLSGEAVKLIDFGLVEKPAAAADDLRALGALGFALVTGQDVEAGALPQPSAAVPEPLDRLLRDLASGQVEDASKAQQKLAALALPPPPAVPPRARRRTWWLALGAVSAVLAAAIVLRPDSSPTDVEPAELEDAAWEEELGAGDDGAEEQLNDPAESARTQQATKRPARSAQKTPSAKALTEQISRFETRLRRDVRPGSDFDQAMFVLNKQKLRLAGSPSREDRAEVARQLRAWRVSYLKR